MSSLTSAQANHTLSRPRGLAWRAVVGVLAYNIIAALVAIATDWRARFDPPPDQGSVSSELALNGSAISAPIAPLALLAAGALLARRQDRWKVLGLVGIAIAGALFVVGALGEITASPSIHTPQAVLIFAGVVHSAIGIALIGLATSDFIRGRTSDGAPRPL